ncbi:hypothetical protein K32_05810 [Kaistia sp. 32K]|uniref:sugar ABC transporter substrate-binding protein n=1 Tax=Kaistia sp. 32K TaxID=2795690 RepID=UPI001915B76D|nr:substrate-binding domain-containing protein [Kaistia sp. 32K]BCP51964.1 hypothetical protein K32_05810 [Kaistia sp. 32K]
MSYKAARSTGLTFGAAIAALLALSQASPAAEKNLLWVNPLRDHPVCKIMQAGFLDKCKELGYACEIVGNPSATSFDIPASIPLADAALARTQFAAVAVVGNDPAINTYISRLARDGYPVVTWHILPPEGSVPGLKAATGEVIPEAGANAAIAMGDKLGGKGVVAVTEGSYNTAENDMAAAFKKTMAEKYPDIRVLDPELEGYEPSAAQAKAVALLQGHADVTGAFSTTGNGLQTWSGAARAAGRKLVIIGMDYTRQNLDLIKSGEAYGIVAQPLYEEGAKVAELSAALAEGKAVDYLNPLPAKVATAADLEPYYAMLKSAGQ